MKLQQALGLFCLKLTKIRVTASDNQICFFFILSIEKIKIIFSWALLNPRTTDQLTTDPPAQGLTESIIIFERLDNRNIHFTEHKQLEKCITILRYIIQKVYWFPSQNTYGGVHYFYFSSF